MQKRRISTIALLVTGVATGLLVLASAIIAFAGLHDQLGHADIGLVLGSKVELDGTPSPRLRARLDRTLELYHDGYFPAVIVSGGTGKEGHDEAAVMWDYLIAHDVPQERITTDSGGNDTFLSAKNTLEIMRRRKLGSVMVISQYFHVPRARLALERFGIQRVYSARAHLFELRDLYSVPREVFGYLSYSLRRYDSQHTSADPAH